MAKKGVIDSNADVKLPRTGCFLILWEYNQIKNIQPAKNRPARKEIRLENNKARILITK